MKKICFLFCFTILYSFGFSQSNSVPTIGQMNNYSAGDTLEWKVSNFEGGPPEWYQMVMFLSRTDYGDDSIVLCEDANSNYWGYQPETCSATLFLDSAYYYSPFEDYDSSSITITLGDTIYQEWSHYYTAAPCNDYQTDSIIINLYSEYKLSIGNTYTSYNVNGCGVTDWTLIYYHKANGVQGGTFYDFTSGIADLTLTNVKVIPNPVSSNFQLQFSDYPIAQTYLQIIDGLGRTVEQQEIHSSTTNINRGNLSNGIYFWQVKANNNIVAKGKLILE